MLFDLKPGRVALVFVDEVGVITGSVPGAMELLAPFPGLPAFLGAWSKEWGTGAGGYWSVFAFQRNTLRGLLSTAIDLVLPERNAGLRLTRRKVSHPPKLPGVWD